MKNSIVNQILLIIVPLFGFLISCSPEVELNSDLTNNFNLSEPDGLELSEPIPLNSLDARVGCTTISDGCGKGNYTNCVKYARCKQPKLPFGLNSYQDKVNIINTQTAKAGYVAIIDVGNNFGHVAYVMGVSGSKITLRETNWCSTSKVSTRTGSKSALSITGFFKP
ncbi:MAG: CHAP domain-containing protein [Saprospiraceae bacterium]